jgi:hypothetical protein
MQFSKNVKKLLEQNIYTDKAKIEIIEKDLCKITWNESNIEEYLQIMKYENEKLLRLSWAISPEYAKRLHNFIFNDPLIKMIEFDMPEDQNFYINNQNVARSEIDSSGGKHIALSVNNLENLYNNNKEWKGFTNKELWHLVIGEKKDKEKTDDRLIVDRLSNALARYNFYNERRNLEEELSKNFTTWLTKQKTQISNIKTEVNRVDVSFKINETSYYAELKVCDRQNTNIAIRNALGQLIEYSYYPGNKQASFLIIVLDQEPTVDDINFIKVLREKHCFPLKICWRTKTGFKIHEGL